LIPSDKTIIAFRNHIDIARLSCETPGERLWNRTTIMVSPAETPTVPAAAVAVAAPSHKSSQHDTEHYVWLVDQQHDPDSRGGKNWNARVFGSSREKDRFLASFVEKEDEKRILGVRVQKMICLQPPQHDCTSGTAPTDTAQQEEEDDDDETTGISDYEGLVKRFELFRRVIEHEDDLLNQRMSWIILAQSFLMAAFISSSSSSSSSSDTSSNSNRTAAFLYVTASVGLLTVLVTLPALVAAGKNIEVQQQIYFSGLPSDSLCRRMHGHDRDLNYENASIVNTTTTTSNSFSSHGRNHLLPNTAFRSRFAFPILTTVVLLSIVQVAGWCGLLMALVMVEDD
jgi:hypothetical protein